MATYDLRKPQDKTLSRKMMKDLTGRVVVTVHTYLEMVETLQKQEVALAKRDSEYYAVLNIVSSMSGANVPKEKVEKKRLGFDTSAVRKTS